ncbi:MULTISPECIES: pesticin immunity protein [Sphingobium]|jgi:hypothetical protein|nr:MULTISPECIES: pesticin immunity protein [Sphingobium]MDV3482152.1 hypothetical protein [Sphingobium yanoikuyae]QNG45553.1 pesticin immunity protein [Sphingobium yanoikuyae]
MNTIKMLVSATLLVPSTSAISAVDPSPVESVIDRLDLTSFPNSIGPRRVAEKKTFSEYGFIVIKKTASGAYLELDSHRWEMSFNVLSAKDGRMTVCFGDRALGGGTYNALSALSLSKTTDGMWIAKQLKGGLPNCRNKPEV